MKKEETTPSSARTKARPKDKNHIKKGNTVNVRFFYAAVTLLILLLGLGSRHFPEALPGFVTAHFGDALWASMIYFGSKTLWVKKPIAWTAWCSLTFCFAIEASQLYQGDWINDLRHHWPGALILGQGFLWIDLIRYAAGILLSFGIDRNIFTRFITGRLPASL